MKKLALLFVALLLITLSACIDDDDNPPLPPTAASLVFPNENTECNEGIVLSDTESSVTFRWDAGSNVLSYELQLTNLLTNTLATYTTSITELEITIQRGTPYAWSITSIGTVNTTNAQSSRWKFYNAGTGTVSYAPFPAEVVAPINGAQIDSGIVSLQWSANDVDNDIVSYNILFDTVNPPSINAGSSTTSSFNQNTLVGTTYYWQVVCQDASGNSSTSSVFQFSTN